jgi:Recombination endonuclease VII/NUMOD3 motif
MPKGHFVKTEAHKQHIAEATKASWTDERKERASVRGAPWNIGREVTEAERLARSVANAGLGNPFSGKKHTQESRDKISQANKGKARFPGRLRRYGVTEEIYWQKREEGFRWCSGCSAFIEATQFRHSKNPLCIPCDALGKRRRWDALPEEEQKRRKQAQYQREKDKARNRSLQKRYGVTSEWYDAQLEKQGGKCAICKGAHQDRGQTKADGTKYRLAVDHDHVTGKARKLLCQICNLMLDVVENYSDWHGSAQSYLAECAREALAELPA